MSVPAVFGVEWDANRTRYQLANVRGTESLVLGGLGDDRKWWTLRVEDPSRFGLVSPPRDFADFWEVARRFLEAIGYGHHEDPPPGVV